MIAFTPDSKQLAVTYGKGAIAFFDMTTGRQARTLQYPLGPHEAFGVLDFSLSPDGDLAAVLYGAYGGRLDMWDLATRTFESLTESMLGSYSSVVFSPDGVHLAVGPSFDPPSGTVEGTDYQVEIWEPAGDTWASQKVLVDAKPGFAFSPDGAMLATLSGIDYMVSITNPGPQSYGMLPLVRGGASCRWMVFRSAWLTAQMEKPSLSARHQRRLVFQVRPALFWSM